MANNRKVLISNLPQGSTSNEIIQELFKSQNFKYSNINLNGSSATVTLANASEAKRAAKLINGQLFKGSRILVNEAPSNQTSTQSSSGTGSSFVVVGNLSFDFTEGQFEKLMSPHGEIKNVFLVRGKISKKSKGYGFIEYKHKESATKAKEHFMKTDAKFVDGRIIRVETVASTLTVGEAKHSRTVFVDKLPKMFEDENQLINMFSSAGNVTFCKLARTKQGQPRGYALIDYSTVVEAERGQQQLDGTPFGDSNIRVSFCTPGKSAQDIFAKFDDSNHRQPGGGAGRGQAPFRPGMVGPNRPRIPNLLAGNVVPLMGGFGGRPGLPQPGPLRTPFGVGGMPRPMDMMRPRPPMMGLNPMGPPNLMGPLNPVGLPGPFPGPPLRIPVSQHGPNIRAPRFPTPGIRPNIKPGQGVRKVRPNNKRALVTIKPRNKSKKTLEKTSELANKLKEEANKMLEQAKADAKTNQQGEVKDQKVAQGTSKAKEIKPKGAVSEKPGVNKVEKVQPKQEEKEEKPKVSEPDSVAVIQELGETVAPVTTKSSDDEVLKPVVFMDSEQLKQFQQFQELLKKQKESEKSGDSKAISLEDLVAAAKKTKESENEETSKQTSKPETAKPSSGSAKATATTKPSPPAPASTKSLTELIKPLSTTTKSSHVSTKPSKPSPATTKASPSVVIPSPATIKLSAAIANSPSIPARHSPVEAKPSSARFNTTSKSTSSTSKPSSAPVRSTQRQEKSKTPSHSSHPRPSQHQQRSQTEDSKFIKAVGSYERERKQHDRNSYHDSKPITPSRNGGPSSSPLQTTPKLSIGVNLLQKLFGGKITNTQDYGNDQHTTTNQAGSRSSYGNQSGGKSSSPINELLRGLSNQQPQYGYNQDAEYFNFEHLHFAMAEGGGW